MHEAMRKSLGGGQDMTVTTGVTRLPVRDDLFIRYRWNTVAGWGTRIPRVAVVRVNVMR